MNIDNHTDVDAVRQEISERFKQYRISCSVSQKELSERSMVSLRSISRFENGEDISVSNLIKLLQAINLGGNLEVLIPDYAKRPSYYVQKDKIRKRVRQTKPESRTWKWGDEQ